MMDGPYETTKGTRTPSALDGAAISLALTATHITDGCDKGYIAQRATTLREIRLQLLLQLVHMQPKLVQPLSSSLDTKPVLDRI